MRDRASRSRRSPLLQCTRARASKKIYTTDRQAGRFIGLISATDVYLRHDRHGARVQIVIAIDRSISAGISRCYVCIYIVRLIIMRLAGLCGFWNAGK